MIRSRFLPLALLAAVVATFASVAPAPPAMAACLSQGEARRAIRSGEALRLGEIARQVGGDILNAELCERGRRLVYRLQVMKDGGRVVRVVVDASSGQVLR